MMLLLLIVVVWGWEKNTHSKSILAFVVLKLDYDAIIACSWSVYFHSTFGRNHSLKWKRRDFKEIPSKMILFLLLISWCLLMHIILFNRFIFVQPYSLTQHFLNSRFFIKFFLPEISFQLIHCLQKRQIFYWVFDKFTSQRDAQHIHFKALCSLFVSQQAKVIHILFYGDRSMSLFFVV